MESGLEHYIGCIRQIPRLTPEETVTVGARCAAGDVAAQQRMVEANLRLVVHVAYRFQNRGLSMEDMVAEGNIGLMRAAEKFRPELGTIATYAVWLIRQSILRAITRAQHIRLPENVALDVYRLVRTQRHLRLELGREPTELGVSTAWIGQVRDKALVCLRQKMSKYLERTKPERDHVRLQQELQALRNLALEAA